MFNSIWYQTLNRPFLSPPAWVFPPMWTFLYITIFVSLVFYAKDFNVRDKKWGYTLFLLQMLANFAWTPVFFGLKNIALSLAIIILLDVLVLFNIIEFYKNSKISGLLLIPYFIWILFATYLNFGYLVLN